MKIPRWYLQQQDPVSTRELHVFCDASTLAYGTVAYLLTKFKDQVQVSLVMAKNRVVPLKITTLTIPRLELEAAVLSTRITAAIIKGHNFHIEEIHYWTDLQVVLKWIHSEASQFVVFVANRVGQIHEASRVEQRKFVPTKLNPAGKINSKVDQKSWLNGPEFLKLPPEQWPTGFNSTLDLEALEFKKSAQVMHIMDPNFQFFERFSSYWKLIKTAAIIFRIAGNARKDHPKRNGPISVDDIQAAKIKLEKIAQQQSFPELKENDKILPRNHRLQRLFPFRDSDGLLRVKGRLGKSASISIATKHPIILDPNHHYTQLLIFHHHKLLSHEGYESVLNSLRMKYWVVNGRQAVRKTFRTCQTCKNLKVKPIPPIMASLPSYRVTAQTRPYFGPMEVTVGRRREKRWGVLFTCMTARAVHLELANSLSSDSCIMALRRFIARRQKPEKILSDNATNFKGASVKLKRALEEMNPEKLAVECAAREISWTFIPPGAPYMGGCWERLIGSVKIALKAILHEQAPHEETLLIFMAEAEAIVNQHPLTHVPVNPLDGEALTPNHFLHVTSSEEVMGAEDSRAGVFSDTDLCLRKQWRKAQRMADQFWKRWVHEYLPTLIKQSKWFHHSKPIQNGDIVIIVDENAPRNQWLKAIVTETHPGDDGIIRVATVKTNGNFFKRPLTKLCILELQNEDEDYPSSGGRMSSIMQNSHDANEMEDSRSPLTTDNENNTGSGITEITKTVSNNTNKTQNNDEVPTQVVTNVKGPFNAGVKGKKKT